MMVAGACPADVAREMGLPDTTVRQWRDQAGKDIDFVALREQQKKQFVARAWDVAQTAINMIMQRVERASGQELELDDLLGEIEKSDDPQAVKRAAIARIKQLQMQDARDLATMLGIIIDKAALVAGEQTANIGLTTTVKVTLTDE